jgi:hypothetical protein
MNAFEAAGLFPQNIDRALNRRGVRTDATDYEKKMDESCPSFLISGKAITTTEAIIAVEEKKLIAAQRKAKLKKIKNNYFSLKC